MLLLLPSLKRTAAPIRVISHLVRKRPVFAGFNVTNRCQLRCSFCSVPQHNIPELTSREITKVIAGLSRLGVIVVGLTGGEPFLRADLDCIVSTLQQRGLLCTLVTNGLLTGEIWGRKLRPYGNIIQIALSVDSLDMHRYSSYRRGGRLPEALRNFLDFREFGPNTYYKINVVMTSDNLGEIEQILLLAERLDMYVSVIPLNSAPGGLHRSPDFWQSITDEERKQMADKFLELRQWKRAGSRLWDHRDFYTFASQYVLREPMGPCFAGQLFFDVRPDGSLAFCNELPPFADLTKNEKLDWLKVQKIRRKWQKRIDSCRLSGGCCYTCSYNIVATAVNLPAYLWDYLRLRSMK